MGNENCCKATNDRQPPVEARRNRRTWARKTNIGWVPLDEIIKTDTDNESLQFNLDTFGEGVTFSNPTKKKYLRINSLSKRKTELEFEENELIRQ